jgi:hypothetical protein
MAGFQMSTEVEMRFPKRKLRRAVEDDHVDRADV